MASQQENTPGCQHELQHYQEVIGGIDVLGERRQRHGRNGLPDKGFIVSQGQRKTMVNWRIV
jgi:hypothetical protein